VAGRLTVCGAVELYQRAPNAQPLVRGGLTFFEKPVHLTGVECWQAQKLQTGWLFALVWALRTQPAQPDSVWQLVRAREQRRGLNQLERTR